jgi:hypothetical protein
MEHIEEILRATYEKNNRGEISNEEEDTHVLI